MPHAPAKQERLNILLLCDDHPGSANTTLDHIDAFRRYSRHQVKTFNPRHLKGSISLDLNEFDVVVIHYSLVLSSDRYVSADIRDKLRRYGRLKVLFIQDEYRWVERVTSASREAGINVLFTIAPKLAASQIYDMRLPGVRRIETLTGYVPESLQELPRRPFAERSIEVGYRGRQLPFWVGRLSQEKAWVAQEFLVRGSKYGLRMDIGWREEDRIYGQRWTEFIASSRTMLGTESGASITDFDGSVERAVRAYLRDHPGAPFDEVLEKVLRPYEGNVMMNIISPRVFEAAALGTPLVMFPGYYSGIVTPGEHYIVLEKDFSNMDEVVSQLRDDEVVAAVAERAHDHLIKSRRWSYQTFIRDFDDVVAEEAQRPRGVSFAPRHRLAQVERSLRVPPLRVRLARGALAVAAGVRGKDFARRWDIESGAFAKGALALRAGLGDPRIRAIFLAGRRAGMGLDSLLEEILDLSLLMRAANGKLKTVDRFTVTSDFDNATGTLRFVSRPPEDRLQAPDGPLPGLPDALRAGAIRSIEWDHRALGPTIELQRPHMEIGIGNEGLKSYRLLTEIGRREPPLLERALAPLLGRASVPSVRLG